jgi:hypothetical protein
MRSALDGGRGDTSEADRRPLWWPSGKIAGKYLGPHLASRARRDLETQPPAGALEVDVEVVATA